MVFNTEMLEPKNKTGKVKLNNDPIAQNSKLPFKFLCLNLRFK